MDNHPIPQDVTGFKFKIIGSITIKQFGYLLAAGFFALIVWLLPTVIFVKIPIILILASIALVLAFVPIEGRPADKMIVNFVKALPSENQYIYHKRGVVLEDYEIFRPAQTEKKSVTTSETDMKKRALASALRNSYFRPDKQEMEFFQNVKEVFENPNTMPVFTTVLSSAQNGTHENATPVNIPVINADKTPENKAAPVSLPKNDVPVQPAPTIFPTIETAQVNTPNNANSSSNQTTIPYPSPRPNKGGFSLLPDIGNVVMGRVSDPRGKPLARVLVEVLDSNNTPVRAFKTNLNGQFAAATPLPNGEYTISFEDPQKIHEFEAVPVNLNGQVFEPLEVSSVDQREKLRRELFGGTQT